MIVHSIRFSFKDGVREEDKAKGVAAITRTSRLAIPDVRIGA